MATFKVVQNDQGDIVIVNFDLVTVVGRTEEGTVVLFFNNDEPLHIKDSFDSIMDLLFYKGKKGR